MKRRDFLTSAGGAGIGAAGGILSYEFLLDTYVRSVYNSLQGGGAGSSDWESFDFQNVSEVDVFLIAGQSNAVGRGSAEDSPTPPSHTAAAYSMRSPNGFEVLTDPVGFTRYQSGTGSAWPAFADTYWKETNSPSVYVPTAIGGTGVHPDSDTGAVWGGSNGLLYRALGHLNGALKNLEDAGISTNYRGVLWHQGERDAQSIDNDRISASDFRDEFTDMIDVYRTEISDNQARFWIFQLGRPQNGDTSGYQNVRRIQEEVSESDQYTTVVFDKCVNFPGEGKMTDNLHYNQQGLNEMGRTAAANIASNFDMN